MSQQQLYTPDQVDQMIRAKLHEVLQGEVLFIDAVARWFATMLEDYPGLAYRQANLISKILSDRLAETDSSDTISTVARALARSLEMAVAGIVQARDQP